MSDLLGLRDYQVEAVEAVEKDWAAGVRRTAVAMATGTGKGHPLDTEVPTPEGLRKWGDLSPGDHVLGSDGRPTRVLNVFDRGVLPTYRITFSDGSSVLVDADHLWNIKDRKFRRTPREFRTVTTSEILKEGLTLARSGRNCRRWSIPTAPALSDAVDLPVGPYTLGALIANGHMADTATLTTPDSHVARRVSAEHPVSRRKVNEDLYCPRYGVGGVIKKMRALGLSVPSGQKFIPRQYLESGTSQRIALLQGLMDCDGSSRSGGRRSVNYSTTSWRLAGDVRELVSSLGGTASVTSVSRIQPGSGAKYDDICIHILMPSSISAISTPRKIQNEAPSKIFEPRRAIVGIEQVADTEIRCIRVEAADSLYRITRHHIITHNTLTATHIIDRYRQAHGRPVLFLVHRDELAFQSAETFGNYGLDVGVIKAECNDVHAPVMVGSVQTLARSSRRSQLPGDLGLIVVDEAHHATATSYRSTLTHGGAFASEGGSVALGLSATLTRGDGQGLGQIWSSVAYTYDILDGIADGWLVDVTGQMVTVDGMSLANVEISGGDFKPASLSEIMSAKDTIDTVVAAYTEHAQEMYGFVFTPDVDSAKRYAAAFQGAGYVAEAVWGDMDVTARRLIMKRARADEIQILVNCGIFTEGTDLPRFQCAVIARPTTNEGLYIQMVGRVLRPFPGKGNALVLDVAGVTADHRLATIADLSTKRIREVRPGESLREAAQREIKARNPNLAGYVISTKEVDLFRKSRSVWLETFGGLWFIPVGNAVVYLHPAKRDGLYHVGIKPLSGSVKTRPVKLNVPLDVAMSWGEQYAEAYGDAWQQREGKSFGMDRTAGWRRRDASQKMINYALSLGIDVPEKPRAGDLSCIIERYRASEVLDRKRNQ